MPDTTDRGLPFPIGSDPIANGAADIESLADGVPGYTRPGWSADAGTANPPTGGTDVVEWSGGSGDATFSHAAGVISYTGDDAMFLVTVSISFEVPATLAAVDDYQYWEVILKADGAAIAGDNRLLTADPFVEPRTYVNLAQLVELGPSHATDLEVVVGQQNSSADPKAIDSATVPNSIRIIEMARL